jgi:hypothetical protein
MIHMNQYQSWTTLILVLAMTAVLVWLMYALRQRRIERAVIKRVRHLTLVPDLRPETPRLYDWQIHGD